MNMCRIALYRMEEISESRQRIHFDRQVSFV